MMEEVSRTAAALAGLFKPDKINYELLGNMVPHIHWHLVPRFSTELLWPRPIWSEPTQKLSLLRKRIVSVVNRSARLWSADEKIILHNTGQWL